MYKNRVEVAAEQGERATDREPLMIKASGVEPAAAGQVAFLLGSPRVLADQPEGRRTAEGWS